METNKQTAEEFLNDCTWYGMKSISKQLVEKYGDLRVLEALSSLRDQDAEEYIQSNSREAYSYADDVVMVTTQEISEYAISIQSAKHQKEIEEVKEKAEDCFYQTLCFVNEHPDVNSLTIVDIVQRFKQQLNSK